MLDELPELANLDEEPICLHADWAIWRIGQRFPAETLAKFRAGSATARPAWRCALAEQMIRLPETPGIEAAVVELLAGFAGFAHQRVAADLLVIVIRALNELRRPDEAKRVFHEFHGLLPKAERQWVRNALDRKLAPSGFAEAVAGFSIGEICSERILMEDRDEEKKEKKEEDEEEAVAGRRRRLRFLGSA